jgi:hypothetical protein
MCSCTSIYWQHFSHLIPFLQLTSKMSLSVKVLVIGHSFIRRLESWMERTKSELSSTIDTKLHGVGGRQVHSLKHFDLHVVKNFEPE